MAYRSHHALEMKKTLNPKHPKKLNLSLETISVTELARASGGGGSRNYAVKIGVGGDGPVEIC